MNNANKTELGYLIGRDAIYLNKITHDIDSFHLIFEGEINGDLCTIKQSKEWIKYTLSFEQTHSYKCIPVDDFDTSQIKSSFDTVIKETDSEFIDFVLSTYDYVYEITAKDYKLSIKD